MVSRERLRRRVVGRYSISRRGYVLLQFVTLPGSVALSRRDSVSRPLFW